MAKYQADLRNFVSIRLSNTDLIRYQPADPAEVGGKLLDDVDYAGDLRAEQGVDAVESLVSVSSELAATAKTAEA